MSVAILLVSHSRALAEATRTLAGQMAPAATIALAAGAGDEGEALGTDATRILAALLEVNSPAGTVLLMDLGSAILSAEMAVELAEPELRERVTLAAAPFVEGAVAAAVAAASGLDRAAVAREATAALMPKREHLGGAPPPVLAPAASGTPTAVASAVIGDPHGLHARPAAALARLAAAFDAEVTVAVEGGKGPVAATSVVALSTLGALQGTTLRLAASGPRASEAVAALAGLIERFQGNAATAPLGAAPSAGDRAVPISPGVAIGPVVVVRAAMPDLGAAPVGDVSAERAKLDAAVAAAGARLGAVAGAAAEIAGVQTALLADPAFGGRARAMVDAGAGAARAVADATAEAAALFRVLPDPVQAGRAVDVADLGRALLEEMLGVEPWQPPVGPPYVLLADDLPPSLAAQLDPDVCLGVVDRRGGPTSHAAILLRGAGIPAVAGAAALIGTGSPTVLGVDGGTGEIWPDPDGAARTEIERRRDAIRARPSAAGSFDGTVTLGDGTRVELWANVAGVADARAARRAGAYGIGLLRTEVMFLGRAEPPPVEEQVHRLAAIFEVFAGRPITVRTLDAGADKPIPFIPVGAEANPALGVRGLRRSLAVPEPFEAQLAAILRAGEGHDVRIMLPMVTNRDEVVAARRRLEAVHERLVDAGVGHRWPVPLGIMVEVPAAALTAAELAAVSDFFSIGTNDLTQYTLAAERGHPDLAAFADAGHPAVLALVEATVAGAATNGIPVAVCGEAAGDPRLAPLLVARGIRRLSMGAAQLRPLAERLRQGRDG